MSFYDLKQSQNEHTYSPGSNFIFISLCFIAQLIRQDAQISGRNILYGCLYLKKKKKCKDKKGFKFRIAVKERKKRLNFYICPRITSGHLLLPLFLLRQNDIFSNEQGTNDKSQPLTVNYCCIYQQSINVLEQSFLGGGQGRLRQSDSRWNGD